MRHLKNVVEAMCLIEESEVEKAVEILKEARLRGSTIWIMGNGGSAATASHLANDLIKRCKMLAIDVSGMTPTTLAYGNDHGWEQMFANVLTVGVRDGDVVVLISCSGNSPNIVAAAERAVGKYEVIALTGPGMNRLSDLYPAGIRCLLRAYADDITVQEDIHLMLCHTIVGLLNA